MKVLWLYLIYSSLFAVSNEDTCLVAVDGCVDAQYIPNQRGVVVKKIISSLLFFIVLLHINVTYASGEAPSGIQGAITVNAQQAYKLHGYGALFIDVRSEENWSVGHIQGAVHLDFLSNFEQLYHSDIPRDTPIVFYCNSHNCVRSAYAAATSILWGFKKVFYFRDGYFNWMVNNYPVELKYVKAYTEATNDPSVADVSGEVAAHEGAN